MFWTIVHLFFAVACGSAIVFTAIVARNTKGEWISFLYTATTSCYIASTLPMIVYAGWLMKTIFSGLYAGISLFT